MLLWTIPLIIGESHHYIIRAMRLLNEYINKLHIALKECNETIYWLNLLYDTGFISEKEYESMAIDSKELLALLISSLKTAKKRNVKP